MYRPPDVEDIRNLQAVPDGAGVYRTTGKDIYTALKGVPARAGVIFAGALVSATRLRQYARIMRKDTLIITPPQDETGNLIIKEPSTKHVTTWKWKYGLAHKVAAIVDIAAAPLADAAPAAAPKPEVVSAPAPRKRKPRRKSTAPPLTADQAKRFDRTSTANFQIVALAAAARGCSCEPYVDWFTYRRWQAQGFQVQRGQHGVKLTTWIPVIDKETGEQTGKRPRTASVFCRCQVKPIEASA